MNARIHGGFLPLKRGLVEHVRSGRMTGQEHAVYVWLLQIAKDGADTGIVHTSAEEVSRDLGGFPNLRQTQRALASLESKGYIRRYRGAPGAAARRGRYPVAIARYPVTHGGTQWKFLSAEKTSDWRAPVYSDGRQDGTQPEHKRNTSGTRPADFSETGDLRPEERDREPPSPLPGEVGPDGPECDTPEPEPPPPPRKRAKPPVPDSDVTAVADAWVAACPDLPQPDRPLAPGIREQIRSAIRRHPPDWWAAYFRERIATSAFLTGKRTDFRASLLWAIGRRNADKVLAGQYLDHAPKGTANGNRTQTALDRARQREADRDERDRRVLERIRAREAGDQPEPPQAGAGPRRLVVGG